MRKFIKKALGDLVWAKLGQAKQEYCWRNLKDHSAPDLSKYINELLNVQNGFYIEVGANYGRNF